MTITLIVGKRKSGKTMLAKQYTKGKDVYVLTGNDYSVNMEWGSDVACKGTESTLAGATDRTTIVIDDMGGDCKFMRSDALRQLCESSNKDVIMIAQCETQIHPNIRAQASMVRTQ